MSSRARSAAVGGAALRGPARLFAALGDGTRLEVVDRLCGGGPQSIAKLTRGAGVTRQAVTKHLHVLERAGLVHDTRHGRESRWEFEPRRLEIVRKYLAAISDRWDERLLALRRHVEKTI